VKLKLRKLWLALKYGYEPRLAVCWIFGHRDVREIPHWEICEQPWNKEHQDGMKGLIERWCMYCDSGYLKPRREPDG
jgi:hypothetical protein